VKTPVVKEVLEHESGDVVNLGSNKKTKMKKTTASKNWA